MNTVGIDIKMRFNDITGYTQDSMTPVEEVKTNDNRIYYSIEKFVRLFGKSEKTVRRRMKKLQDTTRHLSAFRLGNKLFFHKSIYNITNQNAYLQSIHSPSEEDLAGIHKGDDLRVQVELGNIAPFNKDDYTPVTGITFDNGLIYYEVESFCEKFRISPSSVYSYIDCFHRERFRYCLSLGGKHYVSPGILFCTKRYLPLLKNLEYAGFLNFYTWTLAGTIRYIDNNYHSADQCVALMKRMGQYLKKQYPDHLHTFFYVTEKNRGDGGFHSHFVYGLQNKNTSSQEFISRIETFVNKNRGKYERQNLIEPINQKDFFIEYMVKQLHANPDHYGWSDHNLLV